MTRRLLVLGGTHFVGRTLAEQALADGWEVTVLHRGRSRSPAGAEARLGDRTGPGGLDALGEAIWDVVVDTWSGSPTVVAAAAWRLADRTDRFVYISSRSVYADPKPAGAGENAPLVEPSDTEDPSDYAQNKAGGERAATAVFGDRALLVRAGLILGPYEDVGRLPWWLTRIAAGGPVLAPGPSEAPLQLIDVRDLAAWTLTAARQRRSGPYDLVSRPGHTTMGGLLDACVAVTGADAELVWTPAADILAAGVAPWTELPIWLPPGPDHDALHRGDPSKAYAAGLSCRPVEETVADTWAWLGRRAGDAPHRDDRPRVGLAPLTESILLGGRPVPAGPGTDAEVDLVMGSYAAFAAGEIAAAVAPLATDCAWVEPAEFPGGGPRVGPEAVADYLRQSRAGWRELVSTPVAYRRGEAIVVVHRFRGVRVDGTPAAGAVADVFTVRAGQVVAMHATTDLADALAGPFGPS